MTDDLLTSDEVAAKLRTTTRFVRRLVAERRIAYVKVGRSVRFDPATITEYVELNTIQPVTRRGVRLDLRRAA